MENKVFLCPQTQRYVPYEEIIPGLSKSDALLPSRGYFRNIPVFKPAPH